MTVDMNCLAGRVSGSQNLEIILMFYYIFKK